MNEEYVIKNFDVSFQMLNIHYYQPEYVIVLLENTLIEEEWLFFP